VLTRLTARTVAVSGALRDDLVKTWRAHPDQTRHIRNPVAWGAAREAPTEESLRRREPIVLACGRLTPDKNFMGLLRAFARVDRRDARLVIIGEGEERAALELEIDRLGLRGRVDLPGYVAEPWNYYARAACLAVSSRVESFGMVIVEALAHGLPVVATDCGGPREIIDALNVGHLVPVDDELAMAAGINAALANPGDPAPRIGRAKAFSQDESVSSYESLFDEVGRHAAAAVRVVVLTLCAMCVVF
jgi:glycosyltransferase involved in cell wall biosynthesis